MSSAFFKGIDLFSDTVTRPTPGMREAIASAEVGDEQLGEDPTTRRLEQRMAELLGLETALFLPSASLANEIALMIHGQRGDTVIAAEGAHIFFAESGGPAVHAGLLARPIDNGSGIFGASEIQSVYRNIPGPHFSRPGILNIENTSNNGGGKVWPKPTLREAVSTAKELGMKLHLDGARLFNASVASRMSPKEICEGFDSVTICFSKGLGCPAGAILAFQSHHFPAVRRYKQLFGGALRQSGILSAACLYSLDHHVERLTEDHANASELAKGLAKLEHLQVENPNPETNMIFMRWRHPHYPISNFLDRCLELGVRFSRVGADRIRAVTHLDVGRKEIEQAVQLTLQAYGEGGK